MKCPMCGNDIPDNSAYCYHCGTIFQNQQEHQYNQQNQYQQSNQYGQQGQYQQSNQYGQQGQYQQPNQYGQQDQYQQSNQYGQQDQYQQSNQYGQQDQYQQSNQQNTFTKSSSSEGSLLPVFIAGAAIIVIVAIAVVLLLPEMLGSNNSSGKNNGDNYSANSGAATDDNKNDNSNSSDDKKPDPITAIQALKRPTIIQTGGGSSVVPSVDAYSVKSDLSDLANYDMVTYMNDDAKNVLSQDYCVITTGYYNEAFELYESNRYNYYANFITTDSMMHTYHLYFSHLLKNTERNYLASTLADMTGSMLAATEEQYNTAKGTDWEKAAYTNLAYFSVAAKCLDPDSQIPSDVKSIVDQEIQLIEASDGLHPSPLFELDEDYSQYTARGYYTESEDLTRYFKTMMWYGRRNFAQNDDDMNKSALLMTIAMNDNCLSDWESIYTVTSFFAGASDDSGYYEYMPVIEDAYGKNASLNDIIINTDGWNKYKDETAKLDPPQINSVPIKDSDSNEEAAKKILGYRFMGQRFSLDESIFQRLTYRNVKENSSNERRMLPSGLDLPSALGSEKASAILKQQGAYDYENYSENMSEIQSEIQNADPETWNASLYSNWLYTLTPLLEKKGDGYPLFMQTDRWQTKSLTTFMGSYAELKHDTILYSKQMLAEMGGAEIPVLDDRGYVEPEPELFARLANLVSCTSAGLDSYGYLSDSDRDNLAILLELSTQCKTMAEKELQNETLTDEEYDLIRTFGGQLEHFWQEVYKDVDGVEHLSTQEFPAAIIADIATDPNGSCLEVGTGRFNNMYVIVPIDGQPHVCSGPVYSYYEFEQPISNRLNDEEWRKQLGIFNRNDGTFGSLVDVPDWENEIIQPNQW